MTPLSTSDGTSEFVLDTSVSVEPMGQIASLDQIPAQGDGAFRATVGETPIGLFRVGDEIFAWRDVCPHEAASVCRGPVTGTRLESQVYEYKYGRHKEIVRCPWHGWEFDLLTGEHIAEGSGARLRRYPIEVRDGAVYDASGKGVPVDRALRMDVVRPIGQALEIELVDPNGGRLPAWQPGAHIEVVLPSGLVRHYSLCGDDRDRSRYRITVLREGASRGGSTELHEIAHEGTTLQISMLRNRFPLRYARNYLFLAAGIGITPILAMVRAASRRHSTYRAIYIGRDKATMPLIGEFSELPGTEVVATSVSGRPSLTELISSCPEGTVIYSCGPEAFNASVNDVAARADKDLVVHSELFAPVDAMAPPEDARAFDVTLARSGTTIRVSDDESILQAMRKNGFPHPSSCESGWCGSCESLVLDGTPVHYDTVLEDDERESSKSMMVCVSRAEQSVTIDV